ncbi:hypothetical protein [Amycolatopsis sp. FDAARGOS 1241]|uniref:hypothetical protein n=1 Tax=Amycolatopsis sp. FDAARGOS 1241 TaxID=2778070 RepID=UPI001950BFFB|nr:hypothetical protein [Amycolatopsis sp. FDAARGOS 1241]QRP49185.1 hypothetical protein I6J71_16235 [Amycolatopsis sp. FDAARGOS 1241]
MATVDVGVGPIRSVSVATDAKRVVASSGKPSSGGSGESAKVANVKPAPAALATTAAVERGQSPSAGSFP